MVLYTGGRLSSGGSCVEPIGSVEYEVTVSLCRGAVAYTVVNAVLLIGVSNNVEVTIGPCTSLVVLAVGGVVMNIVRTGIALGLIVAVAMCVVIGVVDRGLETILRVFVVRTMTGFGVDIGVGVGILVVHSE